MDNCPNCGTDLPRNARVCPECGSDENSGWSDEAAMSGLDLPEEDFDYEKFVENEFGRKKQIVPRGVTPFWWGVALLLVAALIFLWLRFF
ncbi:MAG: zinc ribbon domain-containing protein [Verrucomicrobiota bacterium]